jgi:hypothetical protein
MKTRPGHKESHHTGSQGSFPARLQGLRLPWGRTVVALVLSVARHPWTRPVVLILLMMFQMVLLWLLGQMVDLCISLMELWLELARAHLRITL